MKRCLIVSMSLGVLLFSSPASAGFFDSINKTIRTIERGDKAIQDHEDRKLRRQIRKEREEERKLELEEYRQARLAAAEAERAEADRRKALLDSMTDEERHAYLKRQQELKRQQNDQAAALLLLFFGLAATSGDSSGGGGEQSSCGRGWTVQECDARIQHKIDQQYNRANR